MKKVSLVRERPKLTPSEWLVARYDFIHTVSELAVPLVYDYWFGQGDSQEYEKRLNAFRREYNLNGPVWDEIETTAYGKATVIRDREDEKRRGIVREHLAEITH